jgi:hypothetical protein
MTYEQSIDYLHFLAKQSNRETAVEVQPHAYIYGYCGLYVAALLAEHSDWVAVAVGSKDCQMGQYDCNDYGKGFCCCHLDHFYAMDGEGWYYDAFGQHDPLALDEVTHRVIGDEPLRCVLESWYGDDRTDFDCAAQAINLTQQPVTV